MRYGKTQTTDRAQVANVDFGHIVGVWRIRWRRTYEVGSPHHRGKDANGDHDGDEPSHRSVEPLDDGGVGQSPALAHRLETVATAGAF